MPDIVNLRLHWLDSLIIFLYFATLIGIGLYHSKRQKNMNDFFLAGREIRWLAVGFSLMAALNSGIDYLMQPSAMIKFGIYTMLPTLTWFFLYPYVIYVTLPFYRRFTFISAYEYLEHRFDVRVRTLTAGIFMLWRLGWMATAMYVPALTLNVATGGRISIHSVILVLGTVVIFYTMIGGIRAVIWSDVIQFCLMFLGLGTTVVLCLMHVDGGLMAILADFRNVGDQVQTQAPASVNAGPLNYFFVPMTMFGMFFSVLLMRITTYTSDQVMVQRFQTTRTIRDARQGFLITAISDGIWTLALSFVGLALFTFFKARYGGLPDWAMNYPDQIFPFFMSHVIPIGLTGLVLAAILAASVSSIDSGINSMTSVAMVDFYERIYRRRIDRVAESRETEDKRQVRISRILTVVVGLCGMLIGMNVGKLGSLLEITNKLFNGFTGPILGIFLLGMFTRRTHGTGVLIGGVIGTIFTLFTAFQAQIYAVSNEMFGTSLDTTAVLSFLWPSTLGFTATCVIGYLASVGATATQRANAEEWNWRKIRNQKLVE